MNITICGHYRASELLKAAPKQHDIIFISSPDAKFAIQGSETIAENARECCEILFHDISYPMGKMTAPAREHVQKALDFAKGKEELIVACQAGVSRSSAIAYIIKSSLVGMEKALEILNPKVHCPNGLIIRHGAILLEQLDMMDLMDHWKNEADEASWDDVPSCLT